jgi:glycosyltransferase involved in cell wall biosynthesis
MDKPTLSLVLPVYNEIESLPTALAKCGELAAAMPDGRLEVIAVDDGSTDGSSDLLKSAEADHEWLRVVTHPQNRGYGAALRVGFDSSRGHIVGYTDSDNQFDLMEFRDHLHLTETADLVAGFRVYRFDPLPRLVASWVYNRLVRILFRVRLRDVDCSFKMMKRDKLDRLVLLCDDFFIDTEVVARARKWNWQIVEVGVRHYPRTAGHTSVMISDVPRTLRRVAHMWFAIHFPNRERHANQLREQQENRRLIRGS